MRHAKSIKRSRWVNTLSLAMVMLTCAINGVNARAEGLTPSDYRILESSDKFDGVRQYAVAFELRPPRRLRSRHLEIALGSISSSTADHEFVSIGAVWRVPFAGDAAFVDFGLSPTLISGSEIGGRDLGGNFHFTSSIAIGATFGRRQSFAVSLRAQHMSNGGLNDINPGLDMFGINVAFNLTDQ